MVWKQQWAEAAKAADVGKLEWIKKPCKTTGICIYCEEFKAGAENFKVMNKHNNVSLSPNINFQAAINGFKCRRKADGEIVSLAKSAVTQYAQDAHWQSTAKDASFIGIGCKSLNPEKNKDGKPYTGDDLYEPVPSNWTRAEGETVNGDTMVIAKYSLLPDIGSQMSSSAWQTILENHTRFKDSPGDSNKATNPAYQFKGKCEMAITNHVADTKRCPDDADTQTKTLDQFGIKGDNVKKVQVLKSYVADCKACRETVSDTGMSFSNGRQTAWSKDDRRNRCLNYFMGHMRAECGAKLGSQTNDGCTCRDLFNYNNGTKGRKCNQNAQAQIDVMVEAAYKTDSAFCNMPDQQCKEKIRNSVESQMTTIAVFGVIFVLFFLGIIFFTLQAIHIYRGGGDDDDDDDDDDE